MDQNTFNNFKQLKQNDRIEYLLRKQILENDEPEPTFQNYIYQTLLIVFGYFAFVFLIGSCYGITSPQFISFLNASWVVVLFMRIMVIIAIVSFIYDIIRRLQFKKATKLLGDDFFVTKTIPKRN